MTDDLLVWLREQLDEDERLAVQALTGVPRLLAAGPPPPDRWHARYHVVTQRPPEGLRTNALTVADCGPANVYPAKHIARWDPARVLRRIEADRRIIDRCERAMREQGIYGEDGQGPLAEEILPLLALPYSDRPGYRQEWAP